MAPKRKYKIEQNESDEDEEFDQQLAEKSGKRKNHNRMERQRRQTLTGAFRDLRDRHPWLRKRQKPSRLDIIRYTAEAIIRLKEALDGVSDKVEKEERHEVPDTEENKVDEDLDQQMAKMLEKYPVFERI